MKTKADRRAEWMRRFQDAVEALQPDKRIDWNDATYWWFQKVPPGDAARKVCGLPDLPRHTCWGGGGQDTCRACKADRYYGGKGHGRFGNEFSS